ncbi:hypothetical protein Q0M94_19215 (plasmid) [Deinococcus radiomollis]|uniref:hypothetical protein n=1 Tax=Deinococcus radiomollis TaxID=468916 RepID=UPI003891A02E
MAFTYNPSSPPVRDPKSLMYALFRVRLTARDTRENPPFSYSDEEWFEILEDSSLGGYYQFFEAVANALSTNPERLSSLTESGAAYVFNDISATISSLRVEQAKYNAKYLAIGSNNFGTLPMYVIR